MKLRCPKSNGNACDQPTGHSPVYTNRQGFTLLEVLVAVVILGISYVALLQNFAQSTRTIFRLEQKREKIFTTALQLEEYLRGANENGGIEVDPSYREGLQYRVILISDEGGEFMTLKLVRR